MRIPKPLNPNLNLNPSEPKLGSYPRLTTEATLSAKYGDPHAESFPIPNAFCLIKGIDGVIFIDNGLGEHITHLGIAKSFTAFAEWTSVVED